MRLIDADEIGLTDFEIVMCERSYENALGMLIYKISSAPTIDAVPVVRCKDCFYHDDFDENGYCVCEITGAGMPMYGFCSDGERKKE